MDHVGHLRREAEAFGAVARRAVDAGAAPLVPSCPDWSMSDLVAHLGAVHRLVAHVVRERLVEPPDTLDRLLAGVPSPDIDLAFLALPEDRAGWPVPGRTPSRGPVPSGLVDRFSDGASALARVFRDTGPAEPVWTWSPERTVGFWMRTQAVEAAVHRWDAQGAFEEARPVDAALAADAVGHTFAYMTPARRLWRKAPPGAGERFRFRRTDGDDVWTVCFDGDDIRLTGDTGPRDVELSGTASDLMLFLWQRLPADRLAGVEGDRGLIERYFVLVPPV